MNSQMRTRPELAGAPAHKLLLRLQKLEYLVISQNRFQRRLLLELLHGFGVRSIREADAPESIALDPGNYGAEVILWDWPSPDLDGLRRLCRRRAGWTPAVIVLDTLPSNDMVAMAVAAGAASIIAKPFSAKIVMSHVAHAVHQRSREVYLD